MRSGARSGIRRDVHRDGPAASLVFAAVLAAVLGALVATVATVLAPRIAANAELERRYHVLVAVGLGDPADRPARAAIDALYDARISEHRVRLAGADYPVLRAIDSAGNTLAHCIPLAGPGLWGPIRGYLALDATATRVRGVTFYEHRETPGLGAEISDPRWTAQWLGKAIVTRDGALVSVTVTRAADPTDPHAVDGISGATITGDAVESLVRDALEHYRPYLERQWPAN